VRRSSGGTSTPANVEMRSPPASVAAARAERRARPKLDHAAGLRFAGAPELRKVSREKDDFVTGRRRQSDSTCFIQRGAMAERQMKGERRERPVFVYCGFGIRRGPTRTAFASPDASSHACSTSRQKVETQTTKKTPQQTTKPNHQNPRPKRSHVRNLALGRGDAGSAAVSKGSFGVDRYYGMVLSLYSPTCVLFLFFFFWLREIPIPVVAVDAET